MGSQKALEKDAPLPPLEGGKLRLYSMRFCPFAQRARIILGHYNIPFETVNINLHSKPAWLLEKNPNGTVPVYEKDGKVLYESGVVSDFIEEVHGNGELYPKDPYLKAKAKILMEQVNKVAGLISKSYSVKPGDNLGGQLPDLHKALQSLEDRLENTFFMGPSVSMVDYYFWPHMERTVAFGQCVQADLFPNEKFPKLHAWKSAMKSTPGVKATLTADEDHKVFLTSMKEGSANYDYGL